MLRYEGCLLTRRAGHGSCMVYGLKGSKGTMRKTRSTRSIIGELEDGAIAVETFSILDPAVFERFLQTLAIVFHVECSIDVGVMNGAVVKVEVIVFAPL